jgi:hypothetical protein
MAYCLGWFVVIVTVACRFSGASQGIVVAWLTVGLGLTAAALQSDRWRRRSFELPVNQEPAITDPRTIRQLRIQRSLAVVGAVIAIMSIHFGVQEEAAGRAAIAELRSTGTPTIGNVVDRKADRWWVKNDHDEVTVGYQRAGWITEYQVTYEVNSLDEYPIGREVEVIYDPITGHAVVDGKGFGVGDGYAGFVGIFGGLTLAAMVGYQLNSIRRVSRIVKAYSWASERVVASEREADKVGFTRMYIAVSAPEGPHRILLRLSYGLRIRRRNVLYGTTLRLAGNPLDDVAIDVPKSRLLVPAGPVVFAAAKSDHSPITLVHRRVRRRRQAKRRRAARKGVR